MTATCQIPTPEQRQFGEIQARVEIEMIRNVFAALDEGAERMRQEMRTANLDPSYDPQGYFTATLLQKLYCRLCHADPDTFLGGDPRIASSVIQNCQNIARHFWGADIKPNPASMHT